MSEEKNEWMLVENKRETREEEGRRGKGYTSFECDGLIELHALLNVHLDNLLLWNGLRREKYQKKEKEKGEGREGGYLLAFALEAAVGQGDHLTLTLALIANYHKSTIIIISKKGKGKRCGDKGTAQWMINLPICR